MDTATLETIKALIESSEHCTSVDRGDLETKFDRDHQTSGNPEDIHKAIREHLEGELKDGANLIDLYWDIYNWAETHWVDHRNLDVEKIMNGFWDIVAEVIC